MKKFTLLVVAIFLSNYIMLAQEVKVDSIKKEMVKKEIYACPMHPEKHSDKMGNCKMCGMEMKKMLSKEDMKMINNKEKMMRMMKIMHDKGIMSDDCMKSCMGNMKNMKMDMKEKDNKETHQH